MTYFVAISDLLSGNQYELFEGENFDAAYEAAVIGLGGHPALEIGSVENTSGFGGHFSRVGLSDDYYKTRELKSFWAQVMDDIFRDRDNESYFTGDDKDAVIREAVAFHRGEELENA